MDFIEYSTQWVKSEVLQGRIMVGIGILLLFAFIATMRNGNEMMRGSLIPMALLLLVLLGYGSYILYSRPAHSKQSIELYDASLSYSLVFSFFVLL